MKESVWIAAKMDLQHYRISGKWRYRDIATKNTNHVNNSNFSFWFVTQNPHRSDLQQTSAFSSVAMKKDFLFFKSLWLQKRPPSWYECRSVVAETKSIKLSALWNLTQHSSRSQQASKMGAKLQCGNARTVTYKDSVSSFSLILLNQKYAYLQNVDTFLYGFRKYSTIYVDLFS